MSASASPILKVIDTFGLFFPGNFDNSRNVTSHQHQQTKNVS